MSSMVDKPNHYDGDACMVAIEKLLGKDGAAHFCLGNAIKYMWRAGRKDPDKKQQDEQKALWYMDRVAHIMGRGN